MRLTEQDLDAMKARIAKTHRVRAVKGAQGLPEGSAARKSASGLPHTSEAKVLQAVGQFLRLSPKTAWIARMNTGAVKMGDSYVRFGMPGMSDFIGQMKGGRMLAIECKSTTGKLSSIQAHFLVMVSKNGGVSGVARSVGDVVQILDV